MNGLVVVSMYEYELADLLINTKQRHGPLLYRSKATAMMLHS